MSTRLADSILMLECQVQIKKSEWFQIEPTEAVAQLPHPQTAHALAVTAPALEPIAQEQAILAVRAVHLHIE